MIFTIRAPAKRIAAVVKSAGSAWSEAGMGEVKSGT